MGAIMTGEGRERGIMAGAAGGRRPWALQQREKGREIEGPQEATRTTRAEPGSTGTLPGSEGQTGGAAAFDVVARVYGLSSAATAAFRSTAHTRLLCAIRACKLQVQAVLIVAELRLLCALLRKQ
jgi:hypothetical protein